MGQEAVVIPEKIYFKIGEVCELVGVEAHVLRYWETEFSMLSPQKNKSGQRSYRRRDVEMALRVKELLYKDMFTIAGARKKLQSEHRDGAKPKVADSSSAKTAAQIGLNAPTLFDTGFDDDGMAEVSLTGEQREAMRALAANLLELRDMLKTSRV
jgi:DNA-binding transcriptional MerR regulator